MAKCKQAPNDPAHSWETPLHHWEQEDDSEESDLELDPTPSQARSFLVDLLLHMLLAGQVSAKLVCVVCYWAWKAGA